MDIFDWLERVFGFQTDSVSNQREHLVCLLADQQSMLNPQLKPTKLDEKAVDAIMTKLFMNYKKWCKFLRRETVFMQRQNSKNYYMLA
ncbi:Callose synthase 5 [Cardamine amara subsp. amara]|uniref:Callose synthase 5 n=1 Tax=Cardamine amara subsp. amara TaxID=228776 RepID=A0ABD1ACP3_CARAN